MCNSQRRAASAPFCGALTATSGDGVILAAKKLASILAEMELGGFCSCIATAPVGSRVSNAACLGRVVVVSAHPAESTSLPSFSPSSADTAASSILHLLFFLCCDQLGSCLDPPRSSSPSNPSGHSWPSYYE